MGVTLTDRGDDDRYLKANWWTWRPVIEILEAMGLFDDERLEWMGFNSGVEVSREEARAVAQFIEENVLPKLRPGERMFVDGSATAAPDDGTLYRTPEELYKNYSVRAEWLQGFMDFCRACDGFSVD